MISRLSCWLAPAAFVLDRLSKLWATSARKGQLPLDLWPGVLRLLYVENTGAAFGLLKGKQFLLIAVTGIALLGLLVWLIWRGRNQPAPLKCALWLLLGGALGNFFDRLFLGYVIDFIEFRFVSFPVFNIADTCVCVAFAVLIGFLLFTKEDGRKPCERGEGERHGG